MTILAFSSGWLEIPLTGNALFAGGEVSGSVPNPEGRLLMITNAQLQAISPSTGAATLAIGLAANATTSNGALAAALTVNGVAVNTGWTAHIPDVVGQAAVMWPVASFLTVTGSASTAGFTGKLFVEYIRV